MRRNKVDGKKSICLAFEVHQPFRLKKDFFWNKQMFKRNVKVEDLFDYYFFDDKDREVFEKVARKCYRPTNEMILRLIDEYGDFKTAYSVSGIFVEQCEKYGSGKDILEDFRQLASSRKVEFLDQTYYHSLVGLYEEEGEFIEQVREHRELMRDLVGYEPSFFENTELLYNNRIAYDAFIALFSVIHDFDARLRAKIKKADYPFVFRDGEKVWSLKGLCEYLKNRSGEEVEDAIKEYTERGDFERWIRESIGEEEIAKEVGDLSSSMEKQKYDAVELWNRICKIISVIPNGIDTSKFDFEVDRDAVKEKYGVQRSSKLILFLGRLVYQKGVNVLIGALPIILSRYSKGEKDVKLVIVGEGPMRKQLERDAVYLGVSNSELIRDGEGVKVPPNNSESLAACIVMPGEDEDKGKVEVEEMVEKGFKKALALNWDKVSEATIGVYAKVLARAHASSEIPAQGKDIEIRIETGTEKGELWKYSYS